MFFFIKIMFYLKHLFVLSEFLKNNLIKSLIVVKQRNPQKSESKSFNFNSMVEWSQRSTLYKSIQTIYIKPFYFKPNEK
jgi:hypothetical protein